MGKVLNFEWRRFPPHYSGGESPGVVGMDTSANVKRLSECDLARALQAHFRRFVTSVKLTRDEISGEPVLYVEFDGPSSQDGQS